MDLNIKKQPSQRGNFISCLQNDILITVFHHRVFPESDSKILYVSVSQNMVEVDDEIFTVFSDFDLYLIISYNNISSNIEKLATLQVVQFNYLYFDI